MASSRQSGSAVPGEQILEDIGIPWGHQVAVMFQIVCVLTLEVPSVLRDIESLHGVSPNVILSCEPWGHMDHSGEDCECLSSDSTGLMFTTYHWQQRRLRLWRPGRTYMAFPVGTLCLISQGLMADCSWPCTCGGIRASWWRLIGCVLLRGGGGGGGGSAPPFTERCAANVNLTSPHLPPI